MTCLADQLEQWERYELLTQLFVGEPTPEEWLLAERSSVLNGDPVPPKGSLPEGDQDAMVFMLETLAAGAASTAVHMAAFASKPWQQSEHIDDCPTCADHYQLRIAVSALHHGLDCPGRRWIGMHYPAEPRSRGWGSDGYEDCCPYGRRERERHDAGECTVRTCPPCRLDISLLIGICDTFRDWLRSGRTYKLRSDGIDKVAAGLSERLPIRLMLGDIPWADLISGKFSRGRWASLLHRDTALRGRSPLAGDSELRYHTGRMGVGWQQTRRGQLELLDRYLDD